MMKKREPFLDHLDSVISLKDAVVLDIGCGDGIRTHNIAKATKRVIAVDPDVKALDQARKANGAKNIEYVHADALKLPFPSASFDLTIFTMSFHHLETEDMPKALTEAMRVTKRKGYVAFLEPGFGGSIFEADRLYRTGDGDIRDIKAYAYHAMLTEDGLEEVREFVDDYTYSYKDVDDFIKRERPQHGSRADWKLFLAERRLKLDGDERLNIFRKR